MSGHQQLDVRKGHDGNSDLYTPHQGNRLLEIPPAHPDHDIDVCVSVNIDAGRVCATVINRSIVEENIVELDLVQAREAGNASAKFLVARDVTRDQSVFEEHTETLAVTGSRRVSLRLPRYSIARVDFTFGADSRLKEV